MTSATERQFEENRPPAFDRAAALARLDDDKSLLRELTSMFLNRYPTMVESIQAAITERDGSQLHKVAHLLEGSLATFFAEAAVTVARALAESGKTKNWTAAEPQFVLLNMELARLDAVLRPLVEMDSG